MFCFGGYLPDNLVLGLKESLARGAGPKTPLPFKVGSILETGGEPIEYRLEQRVVEGFLDRLKTSGLGLGLADGFLGRLKTGGLGLLLGLAEGFLERLKTGGMGFIGRCLLLWILPWS